MTLMSPTILEMEKKPRFRPKESSRRASRDLLSPGVPRRFSVSRVESHVNGTSSEGGPNRRNEIDKVIGTNGPNEMNGVNGANGVNANAGPSTPDRKGKARERRIDGLAASLGLDRESAGVALSTGGSGDARPRS